MFLISPDSLLKMSKPLWVKLCSNNLVLWPIMNESDVFLV